MDDVLTESPPPSRFFEEDLDNFATPSPLLPNPSLSINPNLLCPSLLVIAISAPSLSYLRRIPHKSLVGSLILQEAPLPEKSLNIYAVDEQIPPTILVAVRHTVPDEGSRAVAKALLGEIRAERVLILDSICAENYRSRISVDEAVAFKLETSEQRRGGEPLVRGLEYFPSGSVMGGLGAALLGECQMRGTRATLCATWREAGRSSSALALLRPLLRDLGLHADGAEIVGEDEIRVSSHIYSELKFFMKARFDGNSELVATNGFKAAFAMKDGGRTLRGWKARLYSKLKPHE